MNEESSAAIDQCKNCGKRLKPFEKLQDECSKCGCRYPAGAPK